VENHFLVETLQTLSNQLKLDPVILGRIAVLHRCGLLLQTEQRSLSVGLSQS